MNKDSIVAFTLGMAIAAGLTDQAGAQPTQPGVITQVADNLYRAANDSHRTIFLVTADGIILADPISTAFSTWLKSELNARFGVPVRYVLYSHHHWDHASGGAVFADTATFVAHEAMASALSAPLPSNAASLDANGDGLLARTEATGGYAANFARFDANADGSLSGAEINAEIYPPGLLYSERMTVTLGGETVQLIHPSPAHSDDTTILFFPKQRVGFGVDYLNVRRLPASLDDYSFDQFVSAIGTMFALDIDIVVLGHGDVGRREDLAEYIGFLRDVQAIVGAGIARGQSLPQIQRTADLSKYSGWLQFEDRRENLIAAAYAILTR